MTLRLRLTIYWATVLGLLIVLGGCAVYLLFQRQQWARLDGALLEEADTTAQLIARMGPESAQPMALRLSVERDLGPRRRVWIVRGGEEFATAGDPSASVPVITQPVDREMLLYSSDRRFRYAVAPFVLAAEPAYIVDGVDAVRMREPIAHLRASLLLILPVILLVSVSSGYWLAGRSLRPLLEISNGLAAIKPRELNRRLHVLSRDTEVTRVAAAINELLERIERAAEAERRFAADAAHELRTPLTLLRSGIELALNRPRTPAAYAEALKMALRDTIALGATADELLALTRLDQERAMAMETIDWRTLIKDVIATIEPLAEAKHLTLSTQLAQPTTIKGSRNHLIRLLNNLIANALEFTPAHGCIEISLQADDSRSVLSISDNGPGIADTDLPFIFDRFFRGRGRREMGSGLGLSLCREITILHGGELTAANRPAGGAEFRVVLPLAARQP
jgi:two-component system, OmpR family, sensor kinase